MNENFPVTKDFENHCAHSIGTQDLQEFKNKLQKLQPVTKTLLQENFDMKILKKLRSSQLGFCWIETLCFQTVGFQF